MTTGDLRGCLRKLELHLRSLKYPKEVDYNGLAKGDPSSFLQIMNYTFISYSPYFAEDLVGFGVELAGKNDMRFIEAIYKVLRDLFHYKPLLTKEQFLQFGFAERKIGILCDIIGFVTKRHKELSKNSKPNFQAKNKSCLPWLHSHAVAEDPIPEAALAEPAPKPLVERHIGGGARVLTHSSSEKSISSEGEEEDDDEEECSLQSSATPVRTCTVAEVESRLQALEAQVLEYQRRLESMSMLEARLEQLERDTAGKIVIDRQDWDNLESRVLLLETKLMLSSPQRASSLSCLTENHNQVKTLCQQSVDRSSGPPESPPRGGPDMPARPSATGSSINPFVLTVVPKESVKERLERIANMMNETSNLLKNTEPSM